MSMRPPKRRMVAHALQACFPPSSAVQPDCRRLRAEVPTVPDLSESILAAWRTNNRVTVFLVSQLPPELWAAPVPGIPRKTIRMLAGHLHNSQCMWLKTLGRPHGISVPAAVDRRKVGRRELVAA